MLQSETEKERTKEAFPYQRYQWILDILKAEGKVVAVEAAERLNVSIDTIRRDLIQLAHEGRLQRVHGGALPISPALRTVGQRSSERHQVKTQIAEKAAKLIHDEHYVLMDGGTTNVELAARIDVRLHFTLVTNNLKAALLLAERGSAAEIIVLGGRLDPHDLIASNAGTVSEIAGFRCDLYFMGICAVHPEVGLTCRTFADLEIKRAMTNSSAEVVGLADLEKLGTAGPMVLGPITLLHTLITEGPSEKLDAYRRKGIVVR
jgi:DeoR/GlpR family transcriptional regulator of sugar metabolism